MRRLQRTDSMCCGAALALLITCCSAMDSAGAPGLPLHKTADGVSASGTASQIVDVERFPGADLGAKFRAADSALGGNAGIIRVSSIASLRTGWTLSPGHDLRIEAPITWSATVRLAGQK